MPPPRSSPRPQPSSPPAPPPLLRVEGPPGPARHLALALAAALRERGRRAATAELLEDGRPSVTLASGGRAAPEPGADVGGPAAFAAALDPSAEIVIAADGGAPDAPALELRADGARGGPLASVAAARFGRDYGEQAAAEAARLAALVERRLLRPAGGGARRGPLARAWRAVRGRW